MGIKWGLLVLFFCSKDKHFGSALDLNSGVLLEKNFDCWNEIDILQENIRYVTPE